MPDYVPENVTNAIREHAEVVQGHDAVHPDRGECGGVGRCALMRAEHDAEVEVIDRLTFAARHKGAPLVVSRG